MFRSLDNRAGHYALLLVVTAALCLPNLGVPSLWDIDEGNNADAAREMMSAGNWVVPKFNGELRVDKPALLYWLQIGAYRVFGVNEFSARFPSALAAILAVLVTYELGRRLFRSTRTGLLAGMILGSTIAFCSSAHFANPDALLTALTVLSMLFIWIGIESSTGVVGWWGGGVVPKKMEDGGWRIEDRTSDSPSSILHPPSSILHPPSSPQSTISPLHHLITSPAVWFMLAGVSEGLAMLAKGPVGFLFPMAITGLYLLCSWQPRQLLNPRLLLGCLTFVLVALPWFVRVGDETKGEFLRGFFLKHNIGRALTPMENHYGPVYYYLVVFLVGFSPWSAFLGLAAWNLGLAGWNSVKEWLGDQTRRQGDKVTRRQGDKETRRQEQEGDEAFVAVSLSPCLPVSLSPCLQRSHVFLWCWIIIYLVCFTVMSTKLPNYILPLYPPMAILMARFLDRWRVGDVQLPGWGLNIGLACFALMGGLLSIGLFVAGGSVDVPFYSGRHFAGLASWSCLGLIPVGGAALAWWNHCRQNRTGVIASVVAAALLLVGLLAAGPSTVFNEYKATRPLAQALQSAQTEREIRVGCYQYFQPSLVFYCQRRVDRLENEEEVLDFLRCPALPKNYFPTQLVVSTGSPLTKLLWCADDSWAKPPLPVYLYLPEPVWEGMKDKVSGPCRILGKHHDLYRKYDVVLVTNR